jgi:hypothetical protein
MRAAENTHHHAGASILASLPESRIRFSRLNHAPESWFDRIFCGEPLRTSPENAQASGLSRASLNERSINLDGALQGPAKNIRTVETV